MRSTNSRRTASHRAAWPCSSEVPSTMESGVMPAMLPRQASFWSAICVSTGRRPSFPTMSSTTLSVYPLA